MSKDVDIHLPLELQYPKEFGDLDADQLYLICKQDALDLILIENASEMFKKLMFETKDKKGLIETLLSEVAKGTDTTVLESRGFEADDVEKLVDFQNPNTETKRRRELQKELEKTLDPTLSYYRETIPLLKTRYVITILALEHHGEDAHYGAFIYDREKNVAEIFDSMMTAPEGYKMASGYSDMFYSLALDMFGNAKINYPDCIKEELALQFTGGFPSNYAHYIIQSFKKGKITSAVAYNANLQSSDSQNHFCYMWSIWYIQMRLMGLSIKNILRELSQIDPLVVIKTYCYLMLYNLPFRKGKLIDYMPLREFFDSHFPSIWYDEQNTSNKFKRYEIVFKQKEGLSMKDVWIKSFQSTLKREQSFLRDMSEKNINYLAKMCRGREFDLTVRGLDRDGLPVVDITL